MTGARGATTQRQQCQTMPTSVPVVAIFNSSDDLIEMLRDVLERQGFVAVSAHVDDVRRARTSRP